MLDRANRADSGFRQILYGRLAGMTAKTGRMLGRNLDLEGSWHGNDTVWRMVLDLQRIVHYGNPDGSLSMKSPRTILNITDGIIGGQGEGPLSPEPAPMGFLSMGANAAACDWVHAELMGLDPRRIPLTREAFDSNGAGIADFLPDEIRVHLDHRRLSVAEAAERVAFTVRPPTGWLGHCESTRRLEQAHAV